MRYFLSALTLMMAGLTAAAAGRPNVLFILADDQRADAIAAYGNPDAKTPHIDSLVRDGLSFRRAYCMGSMGGAVCVPSRAMINSGRSLFRVDTRLRRHKLLPELLGENGYVTFGTGKWHNGRPAFARGFQRGKAVFFGGMCDHTRVPLVDHTAADKFVNKRTGGQFSSTLFADAAVEFLKSHKGDKPFYCYVPMTAPHDPRQAPNSYMAMYQPGDIRLPKNFLPQHPFNNGWMVLRDENLAAWPRTPGVIQAQLAEYYALQSHMDAQVGRILKTLKETGFDKNTVVIYAADHGLALGSHGLLGKQSVYEHSMKAPLIVRGPGVPAGKSTDSFAYLYDIYPTVCAAAGVKPPAAVEGVNLLGGGKTRDEIFLAMGKHMRSVNDGRYKLIRYPQINRTQLFDLKDDPYETDDLSGDASQADRVKRLTGRLAGLQKRYNDKLPLSSEKPKPAEIDLAGKSRKPDRHQPEWIRKKYFGRTGGR